MNPPDLHKDGEDKNFYFFVEPKHTGTLIQFLRQHLDGFSVDIGGITVDYSKDTDVFNIPEGAVVEVINGLLTKFYETR